MSILSEQIRREGVCPRPSQYVPFIRDYSNKFHAGFNKAAAVVFFFPMFRIIGATVDSVDEPFFGLIVFT